MKRRALFSSVAASIFGLNLAEAGKRSKRRKKRNKSKCLGGIASLTVCNSLGQAKCYSRVFDQSQLNACLMIADDCCLHSMPAGGYAGSCSAKQAWASNFDACFGRYIR